MLLMTKRLLSYHTYILSSTLYTILFGKDSLYTVYLVTVSLYIKLVEFRVRADKGNMHPSKLEMTPWNVGNLKCF